MGFDAIFTPNKKLNNITEIWGHIVFWSILLSTFIYLVGGSLFAVSLPVLEKRLRVLIPLLYIIYALIRILFVEAIASAFVAAIYVSCGWCMLVGVAIAWGLGLSLVTNLLGVLISSAPLYSFL